MYSGIALMIGILIGAIIVYLLMQSKLQRSERLLQQSREQLSQREQELHHNREQFSHLDQGHKHQLREEKSQLQERYQQLLVEKVERYQDDFEQKAEALEAEYEARMAVFGGFEDFDTGEYETSDDAAGVVNTVPMGSDVPSGGDPSPSINTPIDDSGNTPIDDSGNTSIDDSGASTEMPPGPSSGPPLGGSNQDYTSLEAGDDFSVKAVMASTAAVATLPLIPDPWDDSALAPTAVMDATDTGVTEAGANNLRNTPPPQSGRPPSASASKPAKPTVTPPGSPSKLDLESRREAAIALGEVVANNPKESLLALPMLSKLSKDPEPAVRLAAVQALSKTGTIKVIPLLRQALRDTNGDVVAAANEGLSRFKGVKKQPTKQTKNSKKKLPKNR